jgi:hypothetical protein
MIHNLPKLLKAVKAGDLEAAILLHRESARSSSLNSWTSSSPADLRRRAAAFEEPISDDTAAAPAGSKPTAAGSTKHPAVPAHAALAARPLQSCFQSYNSCVAATNNCTGHGFCANRLGGASSSKNLLAPTTGSGGNGPQLGARQQTPGGACFACTCVASVNDTGIGRSTTHWGGAVCQKEDISTPFWLLAGFTIAITWAIAMAIGMLYSVGEEKLPGVIGAGVSRTTTR